MADLNKFGRFYDNGKAISNDLRELIIADIREQGGNVDTGKTPSGVFTKVADKYRIYKSTVSRIWKKYVENKTVEPSVGGRRMGQGRKLTPEDEEYVEQLLTVNPTTYQKEIKKNLLQYTNNPELDSISHKTISLTIRHRLSGGKWSRKKVESSNINRWNPANMQLTQDYFDFVAQQNVYKLKFMDEAGINTSDAKRKYGYSRKGQVAVEISKHLQGPNHTLNLLIGLDGTKFATVLEGASNGIKYIDYFHQAMNAHTNNGDPVLKPGDIIVVDNCSFHHNESENILRNYFGQYNIQYIFLPKYSADLNPVEKCFSKVKYVLKNAYFQELILAGFLTVAVHEAIDEISFSDIYGYYKSATENYMNLP